MEHVFEKEKRIQLRKIKMHEHFVRPASKVFCITMFVLLVIYTISLLVPLIWMIFTAMKSYTEYYDNPFLWPSKWTFANFAGAYDNLVITVIRDGKQIAYRVWDMAGISLIYAFSRSLLQVIVTVMMAYVIARYRFFGRNFLYGLGIFVMVTPIIGSSVSGMVVRRALGIYDNMLLTILTSPSTAFSGLHFMILYAACQRLPKSFSEAAFVDGGGHYTVLFRIMLPMLLPICTVIFVLQFLTNWNDYSTFLIWLPSYPNLAYGMFQFQKDSSLYGATINEVMAGFTFVIIPTTILYLSTQKLIVSKFTVGGLKG